MIDADWLLRKLRLPYYTVAKLRQMKLGEQLVLFNVLGPPMMNDAVPSQARAVLTRVRGGINFGAVWNLHIGKASKRGHMYCLGTVFKLHPLRQISIVTEGDSFKLFIKIFRLMHRLSAMAQAKGFNKDAVWLKPSTLQLPEEYYGQRSVFLDTIAAEPHKREIRLAKLQKIY
jgi:hypothetical protein